MTASTSAASTSAARASAACASSPASTPGGSPREARARRAARAAGALVAVVAPIALAAGALFAEDDPPRPSPPGGGSPRHRGLPPESDCDACHDTRSWERLKAAVPVDFPHAVTGFPLFGAHGDLACDRCHDGRGFARESAGCGACHGDPHRGENGERCERCHDERSFAITDGVRRHRETRLPLTGAHAVIDCAACHLPRATGRFAGVPSDCFACHADDYTRSTAPPHAASGLGTDCAACHTPRAWTSRSGFHDRFFPLRGAHRPLACTECHAGNVFAGTPSACVACHQDDFDAATSPPHASGGFSTACDSCHDERAWIPAPRFTHATFRLDGAHRAVACATCHVGGVFVGTPADCFSCHAADYAATQNPVHTTSGFPTTCADCHSTTAWQPASFDHERFFPIQSGAHRQFRNDCSVCHPQPQTKSIFTCTDCHEHRQTEADDEHQGVRGYVYTSSACYGCHPNGRE